MLAEATAAPPYHQQQFHYPMSSVTSNVTSNPYNHHGYTTTSTATIASQQQHQHQHQQPPPPPLYGKEFEQLESLAIALCSQEIIEACQSLDISQDPLNWSSSDVQSWISWQVQHKNWPLVSLDNFAINGMELCLLTEDDFIRRAPLCGASLFAQLDVWKLANLTLNADRMELVDMLLWSPNSSNSSDASAASSHGPTCSPSQTEITSGATTAATCPSPVRTELPIYQDKVPLEVECMSPPTSVLSPYGSPDSLPESPHTSSSCDSPISDDGCGPLSPISTSGSVPGARAANHIHLWQFLKELLAQPQLYGSAIRWLDRPGGVFKIEDSVKVARLWGKRKNRPAMNYDKLSRSIRQYYKKGIMRKTERSQRLVYQFCHPYSL